MSDNEKNKGNNPSLNKLSIRALALVASTCSVYELLMDDWVRSLSFALSWAILIISERSLRGNTNKEN